MLRRKLPLPLSRSTSSNHLHFSTSGVTTKSKSWGRKVVKIVLISVTGGFALSALDDLAIFHGCSSKGIEKVSQDQRIVEAIGEPILRGPWYNASLAVAHKRHSVSCTFPVFGPRGSGIVQLKAVRQELVKVSHFASLTYVTCYCSMLPPNCGAMRLGFDGSLRASPDLPDVDGSSDCSWCGFLCLLLTLGIANYSETIHGFHFYGLRSGRSLSWMPLFMYLKIKRVSHSELVSQICLFLRLLNARTAGFLNLQQWIKKTETSWCGAGYDKILFVYIFLFIGQYLM